MHRRTILKAMLAGTTSFSVSGCVTSRLLSNHEYYRETFDTALISPDLEKFAVVGSRYDYVFDDARKLASIIKGDLHEVLSANIYQVTVEDDAVVAEVLLSVPTDDEEVVAHASALGFAPFSFDDDRLVKTVDLRGTRYRKGTDNERPAPAHELNRTYDVRVQEVVHRSPARLLLTPITVAADGVILLFAIPVYTFLLQRSIKRQGR